MSELSARRRATRSTAAAVAFALCTLAAPGSRAPAQSPPAQSPPARRAILVSFDGFTEQRLREYTTPATAPALHAMLSGGACADRSRPSFPSVTPAGHAAIWTGAWGDVNGVASGSNGVLPLGSYTILETVNGYAASVLRAEPLWITAAAAGRRTFAHHVTQAPDAPGYPSAHGSGVSDTAARARAERALADPKLAVVNPYNRLVSEVQLLTERVATPKPARWANYRAPSGSRVAPMEISWAFAGDSLHALFTGVHAYDRAIVSHVRDVRAGVTARLAAPDSSDPRRRPLARHFSEPLRITLADGATTFVFARFFSASADLSRFELVQSEARVAEANSPQLARAYDDAVRGTVGNGIGRLLEAGELGPTWAQHGDGSAEWKYLESVELITRQQMRGSEWGWRTHAPELHIDYFPFPDEALHIWLGYADPGTPGVDARTREGTRRAIARSYTLVDMRLAALRALAREHRNTLLVATGEHGMRPTWRAFRPNVALRDAGLLALDDSGRIDLSRTLAAAPNSYWISVNRDTRRGGIVPPDSVRAVLDRAERALLMLRDPDGEALVTRTWRTGTAADSLGIGGPAGGDLYFDVARGLHVDADPAGPLTSPDAIGGEHGFSSLALDMQPWLCFTGPGVVARRLGVLRAIDVAPTVSQWLGFPAPGHAVGKSVLGY